MRLIPLLAIIAVCPLPALAKDPDPRLATAQTAFVEAADRLSDDQPIAVCLADHLAKTTPLTLAESKASADIVLTVSKGKISGDSMRTLFATLGLATLTATSGGTKLWDGYQNLTADNPRVMPVASEVPCLIADALADKLRQGMKKARDKR